MDIDEFVSKCLEGNYVPSDSELEQLKVELRSVELCKSITENLVFLQFLTRLCFPKKQALRPEALKALINVVYNCDDGRVVVSEFLSENLNLLQDSNFETKEDQFLLLRLFFLLTITSEGCRLVEKSTAALEPIIDENIGDLKNKRFDDELDVGRNLVEILRIFYNLVKQIPDLTGEMIEKTIEIIKVIPVDKSHQHILGSALNVLILDQNKSEEMLKAIDLPVLKGLALFAELFNVDGNVDYLPSALLLAVELVQSEQETRRAWRKALIPSSAKGDSSVLPKEIVCRMLQSPNHNVSFTTGELFYELCRQRKSRLLRHFKFEHVAGYLFSKNLLNTEDKITEIEELSSDEEYFVEHPEEKSKTPIPEPSNEELEEMQKLFDKVAEYNKHCEK